MFLVDNEHLFFDIKLQWDNTHSIELLKHVGNILRMNCSLWHTPYGSLYKKMCEYSGFEIPTIPPRNNKLNYIIVIYKRYD